MNQQQAAALAAQMNATIKTWMAHPASPSDMLGTVMQWRGEMSRAGVAVKSQGVKASDPKIRRWLGSLQSVAGNKKKMQPMAVAVAREMLRDLPQIDQHAAPAVRESMAYLNSVIYKARLQDFSEAIRLLQTAERAAAGKAANVKAPGISSGLAGHILARLGELLHEAQALEHQPLHAIEKSTHQLILKFHQLALAAQNEPELDRAILGVVTALEKQPENSGDVAAVVRQIMAAQRVASQLALPVNPQAKAATPTGYSFSTKQMVDKYLEMLGQVERYVDGHGDAGEYARATLRQAKNLKDRSLVAISQAIADKVHDYQPLHIEDAFLPGPKSQIESLIGTAKRRAAQLASGGKSAKAVDILGDAVALLGQAQQALEASGAHGFGATKALPGIDVMATLKEAAALITESTQPDASPAAVKMLGFAGVPTKAAGSPEQARQLYRQAASEVGYLSNATGLSTLDSKTIPQKIHEIMLFVQRANRMAPSPDYQGIISALKQGLNEPGLGGARYFAQAYHLLDKAASKLATSTRSILGGNDDES